MSSARSAVSHARDVLVELYRYLELSCSFFFSPQRKQCHAERTTSLMQSTLSLSGFLAFPSKISVESRFEVSFRL